MTSFFDDFERANGPLGANWSDANSAAAISGGYAIGGSDAYTVCLAVTDTNYQEVISRVAFLTGQGQTATPVVKMPTSGRGGYYAGFLYTAPTWYFTLFKRGASTNVVLAQTPYPTTPPYLSTIRVVWNNGTISATVDDGYTVEASDTQYALNDHMGLRLPSAGTPVADFRCFGTTASLLTVAPNIIGNFGSCVQLQLVGTGTSWTPGIPGSPTFTVTQGTISAQEVVDATHATITYCPGNFLGSITFLDPSTGATAGAVVTSDPAIVPPPGGEERPGVLGAAILDRAGATPPAEGVRVWTNQDIVTEAPIVMNQNDALRYLVQYIWFLAGGPAPETGLNYGLEALKWISGTNLLTSWDPTLPSQTTLKQDLAALLTQFQELRTPIALDLQQSVDIIRGSGYHSITEVYDALAGITGGSNADVLAAIEAMRGPSEYDLDSIVDRLNALRTTDQWSLGDVKGWIDGLPRDWATHADTVGILAAIAALGLTLAAVATAEAEDAAASSAAAAGVVGIVATLAELGLKILEILNALNELKAAGPTPSLLPPIWPGEGKVTWGSPVPIEANIPVLGRMHGVVVDLTACEGGTRFFEYDSIRAFSHVGALLFCTDRGDAEPFQAMGPTKAIYCPKQMVEAHACRLYRSRNVRGTITPWTITGV